MNTTELTLGDLMHDPMIRQMLRADGVSLSKFAVLLQDAARRNQQRYAFTAQPARPADAAHH